MIILVALSLILFYLLWDKILKTYYRYWYYTSQGIQATYFPIPLIGNSLKLLEATKNANEYTDQILYEYFKNYFKGKQIPKIFVDFLTAQGHLVVSDPDILQELYVTKAKFVDKELRNRTLFQKLVGRSILLEPSTEEQALKRKRLSVAFYKDKMTINLRILVKKTYDWVQSLKQDIKNGQNEKELGKIISDHVTACILASVFGQTKSKQTLEFLKPDGIEELSIGSCVAKFFFQLVRRQITPLRQITRLFDKHYIGQNEKLLAQNLDNYRAYLQQLIDERKEQLKDPNFQSADFLTLLLTDELYMNDNDLMKDEISTFMFAATQTTASMINNLLYYFEFIPEVKEKLRAEVINVMANEEQKKSLKSLEKLGYDQLQEGWQYLYLLIQETLRIEPPVRSATAMQLRQKMNIGGYTVDSETPILVHFMLLHKNPKEWQEPDKFIPERFDPNSRYFLTPDGRKRKANSFSPFLGGRRICLGKTFAENIAKLVIPIFISELDFKFKKPEHYLRKPPKSVSLEVNIPILLSQIKKE
ncbi:cytochrome p450 [Stylonychia lemnae]|uniref:Cytochrome p450 n=1 Tax=Stylonychia lemnae TaxID=5949 RepID=A0A078B447_STYLE|nr:cytochrome p450 [Stylonychia lemnae]|eukprot:CDW88283.1 cytochrome p450 [Stylonychia lemnae]